MALAQVGLDDRYALERGRVLMTGIQALVRLPMLQRQRDRAAGLNTAGFISGYRGSPLGRARPGAVAGAEVPRQEPDRLPARASTRIWRRPRSGARSRSGCSRAPSTTACSRSGTAKAPASTARCDVLKHGNHAGTSQAWRRAGRGRRRPCRQVLDPAAPVRPRLRRRRDPGAQPSGVQDYLDLGIHGWAMSRYSGCWVALQGGDRHGREHGRGRRRPAPGRDRAARRTSSCRRAGCRSAGPTRRWSRKRGCRSTRPMPPWPMPAPTS